MTTLNTDKIAETLNGFADVLNGAADRIAAAFAVPPGPNRKQRRDAAHGRKPRGGRERQLQQIMRLSGKGRTRRPAKRR
jgi:hypothetical protein